MESRKRKQTGQVGPSRRSSRTRLADRAENDVDDINDLRIEAIEKRNEKLNVKFKNLFDELKKKYNQAEYDLSNSDDFIIEHCSEIARQIQVKF